MDISYVKGYLLNITLKIQLLRHSDSSIVILVKFDLLKNNNAGNVICIFSQLAYCLKYHNMEDCTNFFIFDEL